MKKMAPVCGIRANCNQNEMVFYMWVCYTKKDKRNSLRGGLPVDIMIWIWLGAIVLFGAVEAATAGLVSIWFVAGAVGALLGTIAGVGLAVQLVLFVGVSAAALALTRPLVRRFAGQRAIPTNLDRVIGEAGRVTEPIDNEASTGAVYVDGKTWTARSADGGVIPAGTRVEIERMEGVKLFVKKCEEKVEVE